LIKSATPGVPAKADAGASDVSVGGLTAGLLITNATGADTAPPAATVTEAEPALAIRSAPTDSVSCIVLATAVVSADPFHCTTASGGKPVPFTVRVNAAAPAVADAGLRDASWNPAN
jgi:hypothetical protein